MRDSSHPKRLTRSPRARLLAVAALVSGALLAGCGGSSGSPTAAIAGDATTSASTVAASLGTTGSRSTAPGVGGSALAFARCMRANGVPNFPDPTPGGGIRFQAGAGLNPDAPAVEAARTKCQKLLPGGGPPGPGSTTNPSAQTMAKLVTIARCMRQHDVPQFPDPRTSVPSNPSGFREITDFDGAILLFPSTIDMQAPAYRQALTACGAPPLGLPH
jgi:hypothetical protein